MRIGTATVLLGNVACVSVSGGEYGVMLSDDDLRAYALATPRSEPILVHEFSDADEGRRHARHMAGFSEPVRWDFTHPSEVAP